MPGLLVLAYGLSEGEEQEGGEVGEEGGEQVGTPRAGEASRAESLMLGAEGGVGGLGVGLGGVLWTSGLSDVRW